MPATGIPFIKPQFFTGAGEPASLYKLYTYDVGGLTKRSTYTTAAGTVANANPIVLDAAGRASIYLLPQQYRFILATPSAADPPALISQVWDMPKVSAFATGGNTYDGVGVAGEALAANDVCYLSDGSGALTAGRWYRADADNEYSSTGAVVIGFAVGPVASGLSGTFRRFGNLTGFTGLTPGAVYYISATPGAITASAPANAIAVAKAESATSIEIGTSYGDAGTGVAGLINFGAQVLPGTYTFLSQPVTFLGAVAGTAKIGGVYAKDVTPHAVPDPSSNLTMTDSEIPANMLNEDGKQIAIWFGTSNACVGLGSVAVILYLSKPIGATATTLLSFSANTDGWAFRIVLTRIASDTLTIGGIAKMSGDPTMTPIVGATVTGLDFTASIDLLTRCTTVGAATDQTYYIAKAIG